MNHLTDDIIFFHIPKAAGTSFYTRLGEDMGTSPVLFRHVSESSFLERLNDPEPTIWSAHPSGGFGRWKLLLNRRSSARFVTFLREPVARHVSEYYFNESEYREQGISLEDTLSVNPLKHLLVDNLQTKIMASMGSPRDYAKPATQVDLDRAKANLLQFFQFGLVEDYERSYRRVVAAYGGEVATENKRLNPARQKSGPPVLSPDIQHRLEVHHLYDLDLYDFALTLFLGHLNRRR